MDGVIKDWYPDVSGFSRAFPCKAVHSRIALGRGGGACVVMANRLARKRADAGETAG